MGGNWSSERGVKRPHENTDSENEWSTSDAIDSTELYTPKRKRFQSTAQYIVRKLYEEGTDSDVTITALGKTWNLHKLYLSQCKYFESMFSGKWVESDQPNVVIQITDNNIDVEALTIALKSLYTDNIVVKPIESVGVLAAATFLQLEPLIEHCRSVMKMCITAKTAPLFLAASQVYGLMDVGKLCKQWLLRNLMVPKNAFMLMEISEELLVTLMDNEELWVMQVEVDIYCMIKKWIFTQMNPSWTGNSEQLYKETADYFLHQFECTGKHFLERPEGRRYIPLFHRVKWMYIVNDSSCLQSLQKDHIVPSEWLNPVYTFCWLQHIKMEQALDIGPREVSEEDFHKWAMRCGRVLQNEQEYHWRWLGFSYGLDLLFTLRERTLSISRNCGGSQRFSGSLSQQQARHIMIRVKLAHLKKKDLGSVLTTGIRTLDLTTDDNEVSLLSLTPHIKFPLQVSMFLLYISPSPSIPSPALNIPPLLVDTPKPAPTECTSTAPTPSSVTQAATCAASSSSPKPPTAKPSSAAMPHPSIPCVAAGRGAAVRATDPQRQGPSGSSRLCDSGSSLQGHAGASSRVLTVALKPSQGSRLSSQGRGVSSSASVPLVTSSQPGQLNVAGSQSCGPFFQEGGDVAPALRPSQVRPSQSSSQNHESSTQGPGGSTSSGSSRQSDSTCQRQGRGDVRPPHSSAQRERDRSAHAHRADGERDRQNLGQDSQTDGQNNDGGTLNCEDDTRRHGQNTEQDSDRDADSADNGSKGNDQNNDDAQTAQGREDKHATDFDRSAESHVQRDGQTGSVQTSAPSHRSAQCEMKPTTAEGPELKAETGDICPAVAGTSQTKLSCKAGPSKIFQTKSGATEIDLSKPEPSETFPIKSRPSQAKPSFVKSGPSQSTLSVSGSSDSNLPISWATQTFQTKSGPSQIKLSKSEPSKMHVSMSEASMTNLSKSGSSKTTVPKSGSSKTTVPKSGSSKTIVPKSKSGSSKTIVPKSGSSETIVPKSGSSETGVPKSRSSRIFCSKSETCQASARATERPQKRSGGCSADPRLSMSLPACQDLLSYSTLPPPSRSSGIQQAGTASPSSHQQAGPRPVTKSLIELQLKSSEPVSSGFTDLQVAPGAERSLNVQRSGESSMSLSDVQESLVSHHEPPSAHACPGSTAHCLQLANTAPAVSSVPDRLRRSVRVHSRQSSQF